MIGKRPATSAYTPYGHTVPTSSRLGFNGAFLEPITGLYPLGNGYRYYSPALMRFHSADNLSPFADGGINAYVY